MDVRTCLWFERDAEAAVRRYVALVPGSALERVTAAPAPWPGGGAGEALLVDFVLGGTPYQALNGGAPAPYGTAASISVTCEDQAMVDRLWEAIVAMGGEPLACGWIRDPWGVPWQVVPPELPPLLAGADRAAAARAFSAMQAMVRLDGPAIARAARGG